MFTLKFGSFFIFFFCFTFLVMAQDSVKTADSLNQANSDLKVIKDTTENFLLDTTSSGNDIKDPATASLLSAAVPGAGQFYNEKYWKLPIVYGFGGYFVYEAIRWHKLYKHVFLTGYTLLASEDTTAYMNLAAQHDELRPGYSVDALQRLRDNSHRNRDLFIILSSVVYILNILDANVDAHLSEFDMSESISIKVDPLMNYSGRNMVNGLSLTLNFKK